MLERFKAWVGRLKRELIALWFAYRNPDTPWYAKVWVALVVGYAFSPIDLIPDFIPVLGLLDDLLLVPLGIWIAIRLVPQHVLDDARLRARDWSAQKRAGPRSLTAAVVIVLLWFIALGWIGSWAWHKYAP